MIYGRHARPALAVAVGSALGACGDDNKVLARTDYLSRADTICAQVKTAIDRLQDEANPDDDAAIVELTDGAFGLQLTR